MRVFGGDICAPLLAGVTSATFGEHQRACRPDAQAPIAKYQFSAVMRYLRGREDVMIRKGVCLTRSDDLRLMAAIIRAWPTIGHLRQAISYGSASDFGDHPPRKCLEEDLRRRQSTLFIAGRCCGPT